ncbi:VPLPA-CTERM sorting domain-containing protein [Pacificoceanicola onchidii]|uniref:VPLPA-CTERM sorting domain-containing protein n=1 Tax=Pacificoceanicola onchidii TaxID=2562685 RepID=UPI001F10D3D4|nr:VPLPA-CTERM sorting domain-containing protein [Pacificoceanicola onchidii]
MFSKLLGKAFLLCALAAGPATAATVGSLDNFRTGADSLTGGDYSGTVSQLQALGHSFEPAARDLTAAYLDSVDVFMHVRSHNYAGRNRPQAAEITALKEWVDDGGIYVQFGGNYQFASELNYWSNHFSFLYTAQTYSGGTWNSSSHPFMTGVAANSSFGAVSSSYVHHVTYVRDLNGLPLSPVTFATIGGRGAVLGAQYGNGYALFFADENPVWGATPNAGAITFLNNVLNSTAVAPVPLPAGLPLLMAALGAFGLLRRRKNTA